MANPNEPRGGAGSGPQDQHARKGGEHGRQQSQAGGDNRQQGSQPRDQKDHRGGPGNLAEDRERARDAGHKGGQR